MSQITTHKVRFKNSLHKEFSKELLMEVNNYFKSNNISRFANTNMKLKGILMFTFLVVPYCTLLFFPLPFYQMILLAMLSGIGMVGVGFNISHDACHNAYSSNPKVNRFLGYSFNFVGINAYLWKLKHNLSHHTYTNIYTKDEDLFEGDGVRLSPDAPYKRIHHFQHIYYFLFYPLYSILWIFVYDIQLLFRFNGNGSTDSGKKHPLPEIVIFVVSKIIYFIFALVIPFYFIQADWWQILACFFTMHAGAGVIMACVVKLGHIVNNVVHVLPDKEGVINNSWMVHELLTSSNFSIHNRFITWFTGGLNFQNEHHLFPGICSVHYSKICPIVRDLTNKYNLPYNVNSNVVSGLISHYKALKEFGNPPSKAAPLSENLFS